MNFKAEKQRAERLIKTLRDMQKKVKKKTKASEQVIKAAESFIKCNITDKAINKKYKIFKETIERIIDENKG